MLTLEDISDQPVEDRVARLEANVAILTNAVASAANNIPRLTNVKAALDVVVVVLVEMLSNSAVAATLSKEAKASILSLVRNLEESADPEFGNYEIFASLLRQRLA